MQHAGSWGSHEPLDLRNSWDAKVKMSMGSPCPASSLKEAISPGSRPKLGEKQQDDKRSSSFDILSKWYIDGELEHRHNLHAHEKSELIKEIESLGQKNYALRLEKKENERRLGLYIETLESKIEKLENDKRRLENTVLELEKGLLGEKCWHEETNALATALDDFKASLENER